MISDTNHPLTNRKKGQVLAKILRRLEARGNINGLTDQVFTHFKNRKFFSQKCTLTHPFQTTCTCAVCNFQ